MSKLVAAAFGFTCFIWISAWTWGISEKAESEGAPSNQPTTSLQISDSEFSFSANDIFSFHQSDATPVIPGDNLTMLQQLADYLKKNPERELELNGLFSFSERNKTSYPNLGLARAKAIQNLLIAEGISEEQLVATSTAVQSLYLMNGRVLGGVNFIFSDLEKKSKLESTETAEGKTNETTSEKIERKKGIEIFYYPEKTYSLETYNRPYLDSLRRALRKRPNETLIISGYSESEEEKAVGGNLAELRAKAIRRYLVDNGLRRRQIVVVSHPGSTKNKEGARVELKVEKD